MEAYSSGEDLIIKTRKPYTIRKQRERWTEEEHNKFLEALKMHGRAWRRIEEHIGTKTAVQIRSHAQKFFSKLEREALIKSISIGKDQDIDIPPPRPKKKPNNPYPRKTRVAAASRTSPAAPMNKSSSQNCNDLVLSFENDTPIQEPAETETTQRTKENLEEGNSPQVLTTLFHDAPCVSISSASKSVMSKPLALAPTAPGAFREFMPTKKEINDHTQIGEASAALESKTDADYAELTIGRTQGHNLENQVLNSRPDAAPPEMTGRLKWRDKPDLVSKEIQAQATQSYPRHVPVRVLGRNTEKCKRTWSRDLANSACMVHQLRSQGHPNPFPNPTVSATTEHPTNSAIYPPIPFFHPTFTHLLGNPDTYKIQTADTALDIPSTTMASFIVSYLLQNPAAHATASLVASFLPSCMDIENSIGSAVEIPGLNGGGIPIGYVNPSPSITAIAAATVAAATAWWAYRGLLPLCPPPHPGFSVAPTLSTTTIPMTDTFPVPVTENTEERKDELPKHPEFSGYLETRREAPVSQPLSSSDLEENGDTGPEGSKLGTAGYEQEKLVAGTGLHETDKAKPRKQVDRSSCGSNTHSGSEEVEMDVVVLEKLTEAGRAGSKTGELSELHNHRSRNARNVNDFWKVSEEGRMAFQALFSRQVLPQSFWPPQNQINKVHPNSSTQEEKQKSRQKDEKEMVRLDLNVTSSLNPSPEKEYEGDCLRSNMDKEGLLIAAGLGHGKLNARRSGFEPYKRCSVEVDCSQRDEKAAKRIRLEQTASSYT